MGEIFSALPQSQDLLYCWDLLLSIFPRQLHYNLTFLLAVFSCGESTLNQQLVDNGDVAEDELAGDDSGFIANVLSFFYVDTSSHETFDQSPKDRMNNCEPVINLNTSTSLSPPLLACVFIAVSVILSTLIYLVCFCLQFKKSAPNGYSVDTSISSGNSIQELERKHALNENENCSNNKSLAVPLYVRTETYRLRATNTASLTEKFDNVFDLTVQRFLKELDNSLGISSISNFELAGAASLPASQDNVSCLTSPRLSRKTWSQASKVVRSPSLTSNRTQKHVEESFAESWTAYDNFKRRMCWQFPATSIDNVKISQFSQDNKKLAMVLQFLHQYCPIKPRQWDIAVSIVNYSLFILENELKSLCGGTQDYLSICGFQVSGSAADGTLIGSADRFDVLLVLSIPSCSEFMLLHNNVSEEIPPGHTVLGVKGQRDFKEGYSYLKKASIGGSYGLYLQAQSIVEKTEILLKKAVLRLNRNHKSKLDSLPFSFQMSQNKRLVLTIDTRLLYSFGLGIGEISVRITPAFSLSVDEYCLLPPLFAVPLIRNSASSVSAQAPAGSGAMSKLFRTPGVSDVLWLIHTENLHSAILGNFEKRLNADSVRSYHKECLMILKALFSPSHHNKLLNKGEVDSYILKTIVSFLLQESPPSAWTLENLANRFSDAVHFLRSTYENAWLPELSIHNPHLLGKMPSLKVMGHVLQGRQRNLLAHVTNQDSLKVLDYVTLRLNETRLSQSLNKYFSSDMWEYEFFMFG
ncbi:inositol 1,4,5-triphosphate receptor-interacting protein [Elysia marginata]|uniref:Inositol 1,4,5-triphosphate receptor-interacting protein n=1 Tax=Elysia marginata TaxID=1093978 RepID=A0AAV4EH07_9GAST|nr:inositol 1,4,5-triphosphate receptor-interacting protein [Elysia marginata]